MSEIIPTEARAVLAPPDRTRSPGSRKEDWIGSQLRRVYDDALGEAIPQSMIDLLAELDGSEDAEPRPDDGEAT